MRYLFFFISVCFFLFSCNESEKASESVLGSWNCEEFAENGPQRVYQVSISRNQFLPEATNEYVIYNFNNLGTSDSKIVYVREQTSGELVIVGTEAIGVSFSGTGIIKSDYSRITWEYTVYDGSGNTFVKATYY